MNPSREQVGAAAPQLAGARTRQQEPEARRASIEEDLHGVEQRRHALHFVDEHRPRGRRGGLEFLFEPFRPPDEVAERGGAGQVEGQVRRQRVQQRGLADLARAEQEDAAPRRAQDAGEQPWIHVGKIAAFLPTNKKNRAGAGDVERRVLIETVSRGMMLPS